MACPKDSHRTARPTTRWSRLAYSSTSLPRRSRSRCHSKCSAANHWKRALTTMLQPFSSDRRGLFVSVDGPSGAGKSTIVQHLAQLLVAEGQDVLVTAEPSEGPIGVLARELTDTVTGHPLPSLYAPHPSHHTHLYSHPPLPPAP